MCPLKRLSFDGTFGLAVCVSASMSVALSGAAGSHCDLSLSLAVARRKEEHFIKWQSFNLEKKVIKNCYICGSNESKAAWGELARVCGSGKEGHV